MGKLTVAKLAEQVTALSAEVADLKAAGQKQSDAITALESINAGQEAEIDRLQKMVEASASVLEDDGEITAAMIMARLVDLEDRVGLKIVPFIQTEYRVNKDFRDRAEDIARKYKL